MPITGLHQKQTEVVVLDIGQQVDPISQPALEHRLTHHLLNFPVIRWYTEVLVVVDIQMEVVQMANIHQCFT